MEKITTLGRLAVRGKEMLKLKLLPATAAICTLLGSTPTATAAEIYGEDQSVNATEVTNLSGGVDMANIIDYDLTDKEKQDYIMEILNKNKKMKDVIFVILRNEDAIKATNLGDKEIIEKEFIDGTGNDKDGTGNDKSKLINLILNVLGGLAGCGLKELKDHI